MSPFPEPPPPPPPPPPPLHDYLYEKPFPCFLGSTSSSSPFFPLSPPSLHHEGLHDLLFSLANTTTPPTPTHHDLQLNKEEAINGGVSSKRRSRSLRKDRHSKIFTAQGPRDRRMRLSLEVARRFFDLQDMLAFDKPSKTVQWLLNKAKSAIKEVASISKPNCRKFSGSNSLKSTESSASDIEEVSMISEQKAKLMTSMSNTKEKEKKPAKAKREVVHSMRRRATVDPMLARECRAKARARARERTKEKKMMMRSVSFNGATNEIAVSSSAAIETLEESVSHDLNSSLDFVADVDEPCSHLHTVTERVFGFLMTSNESGQASDYDINLFQDHWGLHFTGNSDDQFHAKQLIYNNNFL